EPATGTRRIGAEIPGVMPRIRALRHVARPRAGGETAGGTREIRNGAAQGKRRASRGDREARAGVTADEGQTDRTAGNAHSSMIILAGFTCSDPHHTVKSAVRGRFPPRARAPGGCPEPVTPG